MHEPRDPPSEVVKFSNRHIAPKRHQVLKVITQKTQLFMITGYKVRSRGEANQARVGDEAIVLKFDY